MAVRPPQCGEELIAAHLRADIQHDGGTLVLSDNKVGRLWRKHNHLPVSGIEDTVVELFNTKGPAVNLAQRKQSRIDFIIRAKTDAFRSDTMSPFHPFGDAPNNQIAIVQDAGSHLFKAMHGSWNLLVPGSCIDPAGKPIHEKDNPVWVKTTGRMTIPGCVFGFDPNVVGNLIWKDFRGLSVVFGFEYNGGGGMRWYDAARGNAEGGTTFDTTVNMAKMINKRSGFLLSNEEVATEFNRGSPRTQIVIGKALGDAMQAIGSVDGESTRTTLGGAAGGSRHRTRHVRHARHARHGTYRRRQRGGAVPNPAFPIDGSTYGHVGPRVPASDEIKYIILNTGDRLEGVRAEEEGAAYVYGDPIERDNPVQTLFFVPGEVGVLNVDKLIEQTQARLRRVFVGMRESFAGVLTSMKKAIKSNGTFDPQYSRLGGTAYVVNAEQNALAAKFMKSAIASVEAVSNAMNAYYTAEYRKIQQLDKSDKSKYLNQINDAYKMWNARAELYAPSTISILKKSGDIIRIHPIISLPKGLKIQTGGVAGKTAERLLEGSFTIFYADALEAIRNRNENSVQSRTPMWAGSTPTEDDVETVRENYGDSQATELAGGGAIDGIFDSLATKVRYNSVIRSADAMFKDVMSTPKSVDTTDALNAFSCHLNKHNSSRFDVEAKYELPTPEEIAAITPEAHSDTFSIPAYFAHLEEKYLETSKTSVSTLAEVNINIVSEFTGPLDLFAKYMNVPIKKAVAVFLNVNKTKCIDETLHESIEDDLRFCMFDSLPAEADVAPVVAPVATEEQGIETDVDMENTRQMVKNSDVLAKRKAQGDAGPQYKKPRSVFSLFEGENTSIPAGGRRTFRRRLPKLL